MNRAELDRQLAWGWPEDWTVTHARRAAQLRSPRTRRALARSARDAVASAARSPTRSARVPIQRGAVRAARDSLELLAEILETDGAVSVRGLALSSVLFTHAESPLFAPTTETVADLALEALAALRVSPDCSRDDGRWPHWSLR